MPNDNSPSKSVLAISSNIQVYPLPPTSRVIPKFTLTTTTSRVAGQTNITVSISPLANARSSPLVIDDNVPLVLQNGGSIQPKTLSTENLVQVFSTNGATIRCHPLPFDIPAGTVISHINLVDLLGVQNLDFNRNSNVIPIRSQKSSLANEQRTTQNTYEFNISGWIHLKDYAYTNILKPLFNSASEMYARIFLNDGTQVEGIFGVSNLNTPIQLDQVMQYQFTMFSQGVPTEGYQDLTGRSLSDNGLDIVTGDGTTPVFA
jgi:predicted secreted protein